MMLIFRIYEGGGGQFRVISIWLIQYRYFSISLLTGPIRPFFFTVANELVATVGTTLRVRATGTYP